MKKQAFSIVELIVTLSIIAILITIGFISMQGYNKISRDGVRISDLSEIKAGLELYELESGKFPEPTNGVNITYSGSIVWIQGTYGESTLINVDKLGKIPTDPLTEKEYTYSVTLTRKEYNLGGILEGEEEAMNNLLSETNAGETTTNALVTGTYNGHMLKALSGSICIVLAIPSIIINDTSTGTDLLEIVNNQKLVYNGYKNLPSSFIGSKFKNDGGFAYVPNKLVVYNDSIGCSSLSQSETERIGLLKNLQDNYSGTILSDNDSYIVFINTEIDLFNPSNASKIISRELVSNNLNLKLNEESLTFLNCEGGIIDGYTYGNVAHGLGENVTKIISTPNGIKNYGALATCNNANIQIFNENINITCDSTYVEENGLCVPEICNGAISLNAHSTATSQSASITWTNSLTPGLCTFACDTNYTWNGTSCEPNTKNTSCTSLPTNAVWNTVNNITQTWTGTNWLPLEIGTYDTNASITNCNFKCDTNYTWNGSECIADIKNSNCTSLPTNAQWNTTNNITQTWNGTNWLPTEIGSYDINESTTQCIFKCNTNYTWNGTDCIADTKAAQECTGKPSNSIYNTATSITQTWNGTTWVPSTISEFNVTPSTTSCNFKCDTNYTWNESICVADTQSTICGGSIVENATATTATNYTQIWNGTSWTPTTTWGEFQSTCDFDCNANYTWNGIACIADTKAAQECTGKPSNSIYNTATSITQTWNGTTWAPSTISEFNETPSTTSCNFKCDTNYTWNSIMCEADTQLTTCSGSIVENATATTATNYTQIWNGSIWTPTTSWGEFQSTCDFDCNINYTWNGTSCIANTQTAQACTGKPANSVYNTATSITQTWNGTAWMPSTISTYNTTPSTTTCNFKCDTNYTWNGATSQCDPNNYTVTFDGNGGTGHSPTTKSVTYNTAVGALPTNPTRTGYTFNGWFTLASGGTQINTSTIVLGTATVYAQWSINTYTVSGSFGANANGATINVCGTNVTAATDGSFTATRNYGSVCNTITATRTNYTCNTTTNGPASLTSNTTNIAGTCTANTQTFTCAAKPAVGTLWNTVTNYQQTWNGTAWLPADTTTSYNITPSTTSCNYKCDTGYFWNSSICESQWSGNAATGYLFKNTSGTAQYPLSCNDLLDNTLFQNTLTGSPWNGTKFNDGVYWIKPITTSAYKAYCNMTTDGGGWTMVLAQYEADPVTNWNEGTQGDYDPTLVTKKGFALNTAQLPDHNQIGLGKDFDSTYVDYVNGIYTTGDIPVTLSKSPKTNYEYQIHRNLSNYYNYHNPEEGIGAFSDIWNNTLTIDKTGGRNFSWAFSSNQSSPAARGYGLNGVSISATSELEAWTIWVRKSSGTFLVGDNGGFHWNNGTYESSCKGYIDDSNYNNEGSGIYWIKPDTNPAFKIYCDMINNDGGWTLLSNQTSYDGTNVYGTSACDSLTGNCGGNLQKLGHTIDRYNKMMIRHANGKYVVFDLKSGGFLEKMFMGQAQYTANYDNVYIYDDNIHNRSGYSDYLGFRGPYSSDNSMWLSNYSVNVSNRYTYAFKWATNCASIGYSNGASVCSSTGGFSIFVKKDNEVLGTVDKPGKSCKEILISGDSTGDGTYWIKPDTNPAFQVYCDMTTDGGGWTLVRKMQSTSIVTGNTSASNAASLVNLSTASANVSDFTWNSLKPLQVWNICNGYQTVYNRNMAVAWYSNHGLVNTCANNTGFWTSMQKNFGATLQTDFTYQACGGGYSTSFAAWGMISGIYEGSSAYYGCYDSANNVNTTSLAPAKFDNRAGTAIGWGGNGYVLVR